MTKTIKITAVSSASRTSPVPPLRPEYVAALAALDAMKIDLRAKGAADLRSAATESRDQYAAYRKAEAAKGRELPPVPSLAWWIKDEREQRRVAEQVREEMPVAERFQALAECL